MSARVRVAREWLVVYWLVVPCIVSAGQPGSSSVDFTGFWELAGPAGVGRPTPAAVRPPPPPGPGAARWGEVGERLQPWAAQRVATMREDLRAGKVPRTNANQCLPWALPGTGMPGGPAYTMNIVQTPTAIAFMYQVDHQARVVYMNQKPTLVVPPGYYGHSVGHWEGEVLVVESFGFNERTTILDGIPHTAALRVIERIRAGRHGELLWDSTFEDPGAFKAPITSSDRYVRAKPFQEYVCAENNRAAENGSGPQ